MQGVIHGDGRRFAPEPGQEAPMAEQYARLRYLAEQFDFRGKKVLDCGCGTGYSLAFISSAEAGADYVGVDPDDATIAYAESRYPDLDLHVMDGTKMTFEPASFDVVLSFEVLEHLDEDQQRGYVSEMHRVLKPGGTLVLSTPNRDIFSLGYTVSLNTFHIRELTLDELRAMLGERFSSVDVYGQYFSDRDLRSRDISQLEAQFKPVKRARRRLVRAFRSLPAGDRLHDGLQILKRKIVGPSDIYPLTITSEDFSFDRRHLDVSKWFLCLCRK